jgi:hypothetical protein
MRWIGLLLSLFAAFAARAADAPLCLSSDTPRECLHKVAGAGPAQIAQAAAVANAGVSTTASPMHSTLQDFITPLGVLLDVAAVGTNQKAFTLNYNPIPGQLHVESTFITPEVSALTASILGDVAATDLKHDFSNGDDVMLALSYQRTSKRIGVVGDPHRALIDALMLEPLAAAADVPFEKSGTDPSAFVTAARAAVLDPELSRRLTNQSQVHATASHHHRKDAIGPNQSSIGLTWEIGSQNLSEFYGNEGRDCGANCAEAFHRFVKRTPDAANAGRFSVSIEYRTREKVAGPPAQTAPHRFAYSAGYGRPFAALVNGKEGRLDFSVTYDGQKTTRKTTFGPFPMAAAISPVQPSQLIFPTPRNRVVASGTITQRVTDHFDVPIALVWSDELDPVRPSPVASGGVKSRKQLTVHAGIVWKILPPRGTPPPSCCCR